ncbi:MAG: hypothetical protein HYR66_15455 [Sphingobacteriales bacterium]|nr:hypothetical protein [Sphingobacteriales bacterium]MBI3717381.1 hypothetical protein [Sphingobacteriales bacterium]
MHYYTVHLEGRDTNEFRDFFNRMNSNEKGKIELAEINRYIQQIGEVLGAFAKHFKKEDAAEALPPPYYFIETDSPGDYGLRLYCIRLTPSVVILLNGGRKTTQKVKDCPNCYPHFQLARNLAKKIDQAIIDGDIEIDEENKEIVVYEDYILNL